MEEVGVKENVNPLGGGLGGPSKRERRLKLGAGVQELRSRERTGVLAPNATLGNGGGGGDVLDRLKDRLSQHQLSSKSQLELDTGSRHLRKLESPAVVDGELPLGVLGKPSAGLSSKKLGGMSAGRVQSTFGSSHHSPSHARASVLHTHGHNSVDHLERAAKNHRPSAGVPGGGGGAKSPWPANRGVIEIYQDMSTHSQEQRDSSRRDANAKALEIKSGAARLLARGLAKKSEVEEHINKVSVNNSPSQIFLSKFQLRPDQQQVCGKQQHTPQPSSHSTGSIFWNGSQRQGTPYKPTLDVAIGVDSVDVATTAVDSAVLSSEVTGASSSGSSSTPCVMGNSSLDNVTVRSRKSVLPTPPAEKAVSSYRLSSDHKLRKMNKRSSSLGPPLRVPRDVESCNSRISPVCAAPINESDCSAVIEEQVEKNGRQLEHQRSDARKRKPEQDPSLGEGDMSLVLEQSTSAPAGAQANDTDELAVQAQRHSAGTPREMGSVHRERPSQQISKEDFGEFAHQPMPIKPGGTESQPIISATGRVVQPETLSSMLSKSNSTMGRQSRSPPSQNHREVDAPEAPSDSCNRRDRSPVPVGDAAEVKPCTIGESGLSGRAPVSEPANDIQKANIVQAGRQSDEGSARSSPILAENPGGELLQKAVELPSKAYNTGSDEGDVSSDSSQERQGASAPSQKKVSENAHFIYVKDKRYQKIGRVGKGGSSEVYKVIDSDCNIYAMKKINLKGREHRAAVGFYQEIEYLERLRGKRNVIQLIDYEVTNRTVIREDYEEEKILEDAYIYMVLEFGEIDLAGILSKKRKAMMENNVIIDDNWLRFYWEHMLLAVKTIHDERIVHADLKPANFLLVTGELKLIDFGIAKGIQSDTTHIVRDSHNMVGTVNYMSPEALMTNEIDEQGRVVKCGRASDIWSLGCILYQMVYGHTPFSRVTSFYAKIQAITSKTHKIEFPDIPNPWLQDVMKRCLVWDRYGRPQITELLEHPFLRPGKADQQKMAA